MAELQGLPCSVESERFLLGAILMCPSLIVQARGMIGTEDFTLDAHRRIFQRMAEVSDKGDDVTNISVFTAGRLRGDEKLVTLSLLASLTDGVPDVPQIDYAARVLRDKSTLRRMIHTAQSIMDRCASGQEEAAQLLAGAGEAWLKIAEGLTKSTLMAPEAIYNEAGGVIPYLDRSKRLAGLKTGFTELDSMTGGLQPGALYVIGARPRMGKTAWVLNVAEHVSVNHGGVTAIFSLEMSKESLLDRLICSRARVNTKRFEGGWMTTEEHMRVTRAAGEIAVDDRILIDDKANTSMREIHSKIRQEQARRPVSLVVIDYLQLLIDGDVKFRVAEASKISRDMKLIAKDCKVPVLALSQLNRECDTREDHKPKLSDLRESGSIEQDADLVGFLYREEVYRDDREDLRGVAEFIVAKQRSGPEGTVPLVWLKEIVRFENRAEAQYA